MIDIFTVNNINIAKIKKIKMQYQRQTTMDPPKYSSIYSQKSQPQLGTYPLSANSNNNGNRDIKIRNMQARPNINIEQNNIFVADEQQKKGKQLHLPSGEHLIYQLQNDEESAELNQEGLVFDIDGNNLSPIINTCITEPFNKNVKSGKYRELNIDIQNQYSSQQEYPSQKDAQFNYKRNHRNYQMVSPSWKQLINPDVDYYYDQIVGRGKAMKQKPQTPLQKQKDHSEYSIENARDKSNNTQMRKSQYASKQNEATRSIKNKSEVLNELEVQDGGAFPNVIGSLYSSKNNDKMVTGITYASQNQIQDIKKRYEDRISVLEHQNTNLKDQLFYLRAAILAQYQAKEQAKSNSQKSLK